MRKLAILAFALAACGSDGKEIPEPVDSPLTPDTQPDSPPPPDAQALDTSCAANTTAPTTAAASVTATGAASSLDITFAGGTPTPTIEGLDEADLDVCVGDCQGNNLIASSTTATAPCGQAGCDFTVTGNTGGTPLDAYLKISRKDVVTSNIFPSEPITADLANVPGLTLKPGAVDLIGIVATPQAKGNGILIVRVSDCALTGAEGATPSITQGGVVAGDAPFDAGGFDAALAGTFFVFNVPPGTTTVGATVGGLTYRAHDVLVIADELTATQVTPGFAAP